MPAVSQSAYPGERASAEDIRALAVEYRRAATLVLPTGRHGEPLSRSPYRLLAIQAIELFLNAYLLERGMKAVELRRLQHDLGARTGLAQAAGLRLRVRTAGHLRELRDRREYLVARYAPEEVTATSQLNRLAATLDEVARKTITPAAGSGSKPPVRPAVSNAC